MDNDGNKMRDNDERGHEVIGNTKKRREGVEKYEKRRTADQWGEEVR